MAKPLTYPELAKAAGISQSYAFEIINDKRRPSLTMALQIYDATGLQYGPLDGLNKRDIDAARKMAA